MSLLYRQTKAVKVGQIERYIIKYTPKQARSENPIPPSLYLKVKNTESIALRAAYLAGPYVLYVDCTPEDYSTKRQCFSTADQPVFEPQLLPGQSVYAELACHSLRKEFVWTVDVVSQTLFNNTIEVNFEISIGTSKQVLHDLSFPERKVLNCDQTGVFVPELLKIINRDTLDLWNLPVPLVERPKHLVILTHGLLSNVSADMLYLKEQIVSYCSENGNPHEDVVVKGFFGNVTKTERGIKYLGSRVAEFVIDLVEDLKNVNKISFIGHSLGGLVQTFTIAYLENNFPEFFSKIQPENFITIASPLLGIVHENPKYVKFALQAGIVGKTGQDLGLVFVQNSPPLLLLLPTGPTHRILQRFKRRTVYSNITNDGVVPLRTSALLFLDDKALKEISTIDGGTAGGIVRIPQEKLDAINNNVDSSTNNIESATNVKRSDEISPNKLETESNFWPLKTMVQFFMPQKQSESSGQQYNNFQTGDKDPQTKSLFSFGAPSLIETATSLVLPPVPTFKYITDPSSRENVIIHDKVYYDSDLPPIKEDVNDSILSQISNLDSSATSLKQRLLSSLENIEQLEEEIAREYHKHMSWRKVLVKLKPDAHNNIIVRRKYANAYGWPVIDHLLENHFDKDAPIMKNDDFADDPELAPQLVRILSRELITEQNSIIEKQADQWINSQDDVNSFFNLGATGLLSDLPEMVERLKESWFKQEEKKVLSNEEGKNGLRIEVEDDEPFNGNDTSVDNCKENGQVMGGFL